MKGSVLNLGYTSARHHCPKRCGQKEELPFNNRLFHKWMQKVTIARIRGILSRVVKRQPNKKRKERESISMLQIA